MTPRLAHLHAYPFERLAHLTCKLRPPAQLSPIAMSIGEPQHAPASVVLQALERAFDRLASYPATIGMLELRTAAAHWLTRRFSLGVGAVDPQTMVLPVNGTREGLFAFVQAAVDASHDPLVLMPNPFYQLYEGAAILAGAEPYYLEAAAASGYTPDLDAVPDAIWRRCQVLFLCNPGNPTGAVLSVSYLQQALELAERHNFIIAADECYTEIYSDETQAPPSLLQACLATGRSRFERCIVFHSLSKRSSVPGLRSGFVAGDPQIIARFLLYRTYHGSAMPVPTQLASIAAWNDDAHAAANRHLYQHKFARVLPILSPVMAVTRPAGAFFLWPDVDGDDEAFTRSLYATQNVLVLPGSYLGRASSRGNPGAGRVRLALVPEVDSCVAAAERIREFIASHA
jgi:N-succinyldiaminopimelate aminotransferase